MPTEDPSPSKKKRLNFIWLPSCLVRTLTGGHRFDFAEQILERIHFIVGEPTIAVDTHIFRISNRTKYAPGKTVRQVEDRLIKFTPDGFKQDAHHWLILHGRYICTARSPKCPACVIYDLCEFNKKTDPDDD